MENNDTFTVWLVTGLTFVAAASLFAVGFDFSLL